MLLAAALHAALVRLLACLDQPTAPSASMLPPSFAALFGGPQPVRSPAPLDTSVPASKVAAVPTATAHDGPIGALPAKQGWGMQHRPAYQGKGMFFHPEKHP